MATDQLLTTAEVAQELRVSMKTLYLMIRAGDLPVVDLGHRTKRVRRTALDSFIESREAQSCN